MINIPRSFKGYYYLSSGIEVQINSIEELNTYLNKYPSEWEECNQVIDKLYEGPLDSSIIYYLEQSDVLRSIQIVEIVDTFNKRPLLIYSKLTCIDVSSKEVLNIDTYKYQLINGNFRDLFPRSVSKSTISNLENHLFESSPLPKVDKEPNENIFLLLGDGQRTVDVEMTVLVTGIKEEHKAFLSRRYPEIIETYEQYQVPIKLPVDLHHAPIEDYLFFCRNFTIFQGDKEVGPHDLIFLDERLEYLPKGPYYYVCDAIQEVEITHIYSKFSINEGVVYIRTCIDYKTPEYENMTWEGEYGYLPPPPIPECNLHILFNPYLCREDFFHQFKYPYEDGIGAPYSYPFKFLYPDDGFDNMDVYNFE